MNKIFLQTVVTIIDLFDIAHTSNPYFTNRMLHVFLGNRKISWTKMGS